MADYLKSPVFSSPAYWIALGVGVVGIGAAAMQERRSGSASTYDANGDLASAGHPAAATLLATPIRSAASARRYLTQLHAMGLDYHPDDSANTIVYLVGNAGVDSFPFYARLFTDAEAVLADARMDEVFQYLPDPYAIGLAIIRKDERASKGSAAKKYDTPFDPSTLSDRPGSMSPRQYMALKRMGALMPEGKDVHGKTMQLSMRQASGLMRSMGEMRRADKAGMRGSAARVHRGSGVAYNVYLRGKLIDTVFQSGMSTVEEVKRSLINHDGYDAAIRVTKAARRAA